MDNTLSDSQDTQVDGSMGGEGESPSPSTAIQREDSAEKENSPIEKENEDAGSSEKQDEKEEGEKKEDIPPVDTPDNPPEPEEEPVSEFYLTEDEIPKYCNIIDGVQFSDVVIATDLINGYLGRSYAPKRYTDRVKVNKRRRGKLNHAPVIEISEVIAVVQTPFGRNKTKLDIEDIELDPELDGYFTFDGNFGMTGYVYTVIPKLLEITYTSGFKVYPSRLKSACAMLASNVRQALSFNGAKQLTSLDFQVLMTDDSFFTSDIKMLLRGLDYNSSTL